MELQVQSIKNQLREEILAIPKAKSIIDASLKQHKKLQEMGLQVRHLHRLLSRIRVQSMGPYQPKEGSTGGQVPATENRDDGIKFLCKLSNKKSLAIKDSAGEKVVLIGEFVWKDGKRVPGSRGIGLPAEQWLTIRKNFPAIEEAIEKVKSRMSCEPEKKQKESAQKSAHQPTIAEDGHVLKKQKPDTSSAEEASQKEIKQKPVR